MPATLSKPVACSRFKTTWLLTYGLKVVQRENAATANVTHVQCLFCACFGRDEEQHNRVSERKRARTSMDKYFSAPWRTDYFSQHLKSQHPKRWRIYQSLGLQQKRAYFLEEEKNESIDLRAFLQPGASARARQMAEQECNYYVDKDIIEALIGKLLFDVDSEVQDDGTSIERLKKKALSIFTKSSTAGLSFRQANATILATKKILECGNIGTVNEGKVASYCRKICAINLQYLKEIFNLVWAFSIGFDAANHSRSSYLDVRMRCYYQGELQNLQLMAIPMRERHTGEYQFDLIASLLNILVPEWRHQMIGVTTDGASNNTGRISGTVTQLSNKVQHHVFRVWCGAHQLDLVVKKVLRGLCGDGFLGILKGVTKHLRQQQILIQDMDNTVAKSFVETRWISMGPALSWLTDNEERLLIHFDEKQPACTPPAEFWVIIAVINPIVKRIEQTFSAIQGKNTLLCEQRDQLLNLAHDLMTHTRVKQPITDEDAEEYEKILNHLDLDGSLDEEGSSNGHEIAGFAGGSYYVLESGIMECIDEMGGILVQNKMDALKEGTVGDKEVHRSVIETIANFSLELVEGIKEIVAERDNNNAAADQLPPVLPLELCEMHPRSFSAALTLQKPRLLRRFTEKDFNEIDKQFRNLCIRFKEDKNFRNLLKSNADRTDVDHFSKCWRDAGEGYELLQEYCGGIASVMSGTATVESDFSLINWTKDPHSSSMTDFTLESILHCKQHSKLIDLCET